ncbi:Pulmonary surfactant-associated protein D [Acipenser ruthenus]|uniref:Pulmonary surfactant-associated protein D n=1 Tax=Acipenser ruthenus TaxID=7906 RepID=A0A662YRR0_ACIRT|nr:Pulmonary surfactant-associated protein D [Acipenser ruthenus]
MPMNKILRIVVTLLVLEIRLGYMEDPKKLNQCSGYPGIPGSPGNNGLPGRDGREGRDGKEGERGEKGEAGVQGPPGNDGLVGQMGQKGDKAEPGPRAEHGVRGPPGKAGPFGLMGQKGDKGESGPQGESVQGPPGDTGSTGPKGQKGDQGDPGPRGASVELRRIVELEEEIKKLKDSYSNLEKRFIFTLWSRSGNTFFGTMKVSATFENGLKFCTGVGGQIATPRNQAENDGLRDIAKQVGKVFIGVNDRRREGVFEELNGKPIAFSKWQCGEPNNDKGEEDCVVLVSDGMWNDVPCGTSNIIVCEL